MVVGGEKDTSSRKQNHVSIRAVQVFLWLVAYLAAIEIGLEYRAHRRGWESLLWGGPVGQVEDVAPREGASKVPETRRAVGPRPDFPFRSVVVPRERSPGVFRAWVASASHAEDIYTDVQQIFPTRLQTRLAARGAPSQVLNASRAGNTIGQNVRDLQTVAPRWRPDAVVLYQMSIDIVGLSKRYLAAGPADGQAQQAGPATAALPAASPVARLAEQTSVYTLAKANVTPLVAAQRVLYDDLGADAENEFVQRLEEFVRAVRELGATPVLCTFATSYRRDELATLPFEVRQFMLRYNMYLSPRGWLDTIQRLNERIEQVARSEHVPLVDLAEAITGKRDLFRDFVHFSTVGHERVAELIADQLQALPARIEEPNRRAGVSR